MNGNKMNVESGMLYRIYMGDHGIYYTPRELPEALAILKAQSMGWKGKGWDSWKPVRVERDARNGVVGIWFESIYYDAAYRPRVWRC